MIEILKHLLDRVSLVDLLLCDSCELGAEFGHLWVESGSHILMEAL
jgi:hypothetical protein